MTETQQQTLPGDDYKLELKEVFTEFDEEANQTTKIENLKYMVSKLGYKLSKFELEQMINQLKDLNDNTIIRYAKFEDYFMKKEKLQPQPIYIEESKYFKNQSAKEGYINVEHFKHMMINTGQQMNEEDVEELLGYLKINDGIFKFDDLVKLIQQ